MKKYKKIVSTIVICALVSLNITSCKNANELNRLSIVMGAAIDKSDDNGKVKVTVQIADVLKMKSSSGPSGLQEGSHSYINFSGEGCTIIDAVNQINHKHNRILFFPHNQVIIFSKNLAEEGLQKYIDFFLRNRETRLLQWVAVSEEKASEVLKIEPEVQSTTGKSIGELIKTEKIISKVPAVDLKELSQKLASKTTAPVLPIIHMAKEGDRITLSLSKAAVFKKDKLVGSLSDTETTGYLWGSGRMKEDIVNVDILEDNSKVSLQVIRNKSKIIPKIKNGEVNIVIDISEEGDLGEQTTMKDLANPMAFKELEKAQEKMIKSKVMAAVAKSKELNADIFGFGDSIYMHHPKEWNNIEKNWDEVFQNIKVDVNVKTKIRKTGRITKPLMSNGE